MIPNFKKLSFKQTNEYLKKLDINSLADEEFKILIKKLTRKANKLLEIIESEDAIEFEKIIYSDKFGLILCCSYMENNRFMNKKYINKKFIKLDNDRSIYYMKYKKSTKYFYYDGSILLHVLTNKNNENTIKFYYAGNENICLFNDKLIMRITNNGDVLDVDFYENVCNCGDFSNEDCRCFY